MSKDLLWLVVNWKKPIPVLSPVLKSFVFSIPHSSAEECGILKTNDFNTGDNTGIGFFQFTTNHNKSLLKLRCSAAKGYLSPIKKRKNLKIITNAHVKKINFEGRKAESVS